MASNLRVDNIQPSTGMGIGIGTANGSIYFNSDINGGMNIATGSVGVGTDNPNAAKLDVRGSDNPLLKLTQTTSGIARLNIESETNDGYQYAGIGIGSATADAELMWTTLGFDVNVADSVRLRIPSSGDVQVLTGNLVIGTSGKGIDFSATSDASGSTSELLDDYEEGTWTPDLRFGGSNTGVSYSWRNGHYTKIGRQVTVRAAFGLTSRGTFTATDRAAIYGLPYDLDPYNISGGFNYSFVGSYSGGVEGIHVIEHQYGSAYVDHFLLSRITAANTSFSEMQYQHVGGTQRIAFVTTYFTTT